MDGLEPIYSVGDRVLIANPIDIFEEGDTKVYAITHVKFSDKYLTHCYRLNNSKLWVNEAWLEPDLFGPQYIDEEDDDMKPKFDDKQALMSEQDYELACLHDAIQTQDTVEIDRSKKRLAEIHTELEAIK